METRLTGKDVSIDPQTNEDGEQTVTPLAYLTNEEDEPAQILERAQTARNRSEGLRTALAKLDDRSRRIIEARWLREENQATLQDLADEYGVSAERIRQIESKAIKTMRGQMGSLQ
jgi:RNA polymerase sigma-32 factor